MTESDCPDELSGTWMEAHKAFHQATMAACGSRRLLEIALSLGEAAAAYRFWSQRYDHGSRDIAGEHRAIFEATIARDADLACRLHQEHIRRTADIVLRAMGAQDAALEESSSAQRQWSRGPRRPAAASNEVTD